MLCSNQHRESRLLQIFEFYQGNKKSRLLDTNGLSYVFYVD